MATGDRTDQLKMLKEHGALDLQMSERARDDYVRLIRNYRQELIGQRAHVHQLGGLGTAAAGCRSAQQTKRQLEANAVGLDGILQTLDNYIDYLNMFEQTVNSAFKRMQAQDRS